MWKLLVISLFFGCATAKSLEGCQCWDGYKVNADGTECQGILVRPVMPCNEPEPPQYLVIKNQQIAIESLQNQILMINEYSQISKIHNNVDKDKDVRTFNVRDKNVTVSQHAVNKQNSSKGNNVKTNKNIDNQSCSLNTDASSNRKNTYSSVVMANDNSATVYANVNKPLIQEKTINDTLKTSKTSNLIVYGKK
ncbi:hypothetical protein RN001_014341 [Aquatica leii]|uniref:Uncharacterized protein n=1 Tax=Aquatica leii TaxID=1421715 RepID=A0AAN7S7F1_9COLE|nr:hypothetical protein RN001_014341 [Aquatica leii]